MPGFLPPVYAAWDLLVDGAALNNLPVDVMRDRLGCVVAVDLPPDVEPLNTVPFEHGLSGWQMLKTYLNPFGTPRPVPNVVDILTRSTGLSQIRQRRAVLARHSIDLLLQPPIAALTALDFKGAVAMIEVGYRYAADALAHSKLSDRFVT